MQLLVRGGSTQSVGDVGSFNRGFGECIQTIMYCSLEDVLNTRVPFF